MASGTFANKIDKNSKDVSNIHKQYEKKTIILEE